MKLLELIPEEESMECGRKLHEMLTNYQHFGTDAPAVFPKVAIPSCFASKLLKLLVSAACKEGEAPVWGVKSVIENTLRIDPLRKHRYDGEYARDPTVTLLMVTDYVRALVRPYVEITGKQTVEGVETTVAVAIDTIALHVEPSVPVTKPQSSKRKSDGQEYTAEELRAIERAKTDAATTKAHAAAQAAKEKEQAAIAKAAEAEAKKAAAAALKQKKIDDADALKKQKAAEAAAAKEQKAIEAAEAAAKKKAAAELAAAELAAKKAADKAAADKAAADKAAAKKAADDKKIADAAAKRVLEDKKAQIKADMTLALIDKKTAVANLKAKQILLERARKSGTSEEQIALEAKVKEASEVDAKLEARLAQLRMQQAELGVVVKTAPKVVRGPQSTPQKAAEDTITGKRKADISADSPVEKRAAGSSAGSPAAMDPMDVVVVDLTKGNGNVTESDDDDDGDAKSYISEFEAGHD